MAPTDTESPAAPKETKTRTCHACGEPFEYPVMGSMATRFHCDNCAALPEPARKALARLTTRVRKLERELKSLEKKLDEART